VRIRARRTTSFESSAMQQLPYFAGRDPDQYFCRFI
jgi:hypothetical protein